jgi:ATP-grasp domain
MLDNVLNNKLPAILVLFPNEWDRAELESPRFSNQYRFFYEGFDLFAFPENARLMWLDARRFIRKMQKKYRDKGLIAVMSSEEQFGAMFAAVLAKRMGLPGTNPAAVLTAQHKYYARRLIADIAPEASVRFEVFDYREPTPDRITLPFPLFVKPVKATYSILARRVDNFAELKQHLTFKPFERHILERLILPADQLNDDFMGFAIDVHHIVAEEVIEGMQVTVEGFVQEGKLTLFGVVDSVMFPGTSAFERFEYPSRLPEDVQQRMHALTEKLVTGFAFDHGMFNAEYFYQPETGAIKVIEINPRIAYQFADLYQKVDGFSSYACQIALAAGGDARAVVKRREGRYKHAASFVLRSFEHKPLKRVPSLARVAEVEQSFEDSRIMVYVKQGASLAREFKWLGSYRYCLINLGGHSHDDLHDRYHAARRELAFEF